MKLSPFALVLLAALPVQGHAQEAQTAVHVRYSDLDLANPAGVRTFDRRLKWAIHVVCSELGGDGDLQGRFATERCIKAKSAEMAAPRNQLVAAHHGPVQLADQAH
jgi:UrcA family protein